MSYIPYRGETELLRGAATAKCTFEGVKFFDKGRGTLILTNKRLLYEQSGLGVDLREWTSLRRAIKSIEAQKGTVSFLKKLFLKDPSPSPGRLVIGFATSGTWLFDINNAEGWAAQILSIMQ